MNCPKCGAKTKVTDSRLDKEVFTKRVRKCLACGAVFETIERYAREKRSPVSQFATLPKVSDTSEKSKCHSKCHPENQT